MPTDAAATPSARIQIRARGPTGQKILDLPSFARVSDLKAAIRSKFELEAFQIRIGHPSTILELPADETALADLPMRIVRETLTVAAAPVEVPAAAASANGGRYGDEGVVRRSASPGAQRQPQPAGTPPPPRSVVPGTGDSAHWTPGFFSQHPSPPHRPQSPPSVSQARRLARRDEPQEGITHLDIEKRRISQRWSSLIAMHCWVGGFPVTFQPITTLSRCGSP
jgi:hypothetical protein